MCLVTVISGPVPSFYYVSKKVKDGLNLHLDIFTFYFCEPINIT